MCLVYVEAVECFSTSNGYTQKRCATETIDNFQSVPVLSSFNFIIAKSCTNYKIPGFNAGTWEEDKLENFKICSTINHVGT